MLELMRQNFLYCLQFNFQLTLAYSCHYIKERKTKRIFLLRMKQRFIIPLSSSDKFNFCIKNVCISVRINRTMVSVTSRNLQLMFFIVLSRVCLLSLYMGQWRMYWEVDSTSKPQLQVGFNVSWKLVWICVHANDQHAKDQHALL